MSLKEKINEILKEGSYCKVGKISKGYELRYGKSYSSPGLNFKALKSLGELFGTDEIDVDNYAQEGCETCDFGSDYGHEIQIYNPTKNAVELEGLVGQDLKEIEKKKKKK